MKSIFKKRNTPLSSSFAVPVCTKSTNFVTPETSPSPLRQFDSKPPFLLPSSTMAEAAGITTAPLDLSEQEQLLLSDVVDLPPKIIPPPADHKPPNIASTKRLRKRRSCAKAIKPASSPNPPVLPSNTVTPSKPPPSPSTFDNVEPSCLEWPPSPSTLNYDNVEPSCLESPPSPSTLNYDNIEPSCLELRPSPSTTTSINEKQGNLIIPKSTSTSNSYHDVEPTDFQPQPSPFPIDPTDVEAHDFNHLPIHGCKNDTSLSPPPYNHHPFSSPTSSFEEISNSCWISIAEPTDCFLLPWAFKPIDENLRNFLWHICDWELADYCLLRHHSISTIRQISSCPLSTFDRWDLNLPMERDLNLINWWPRYFQKRSEDIFYLTPEKYDNAMLQMTQFRKSTPQRNHQHTHCRTNHPPRRQPHRHTCHTPSYTYYPNTFSSLTPVDTPDDNPDIPSTPFNTSDNTDPPTHKNINDATADDSTTDGQTNALFGACIFIDGVHLPSDTDTQSHPDDVSKKAHSSASSASSSITHF